MAKTKLGKIHAILGRSHRTGRWRLSPKTSVIALLGSCRLDLRDAHLDEDVSKMTATVLLGGVSIIIPPGVEVRPSGLSLLGGASVDVPPFDNGEAALVEIEWTSIFGRLRIGAEVAVEETVEEPVEEPAAAAAAPPAEQTADAPPATKTATAPAKPPPAVGFEDLAEPTPAPEPPPAVGFEDLAEPAPAPEPPPAVGFEDLAEPATDGGDAGESDEASGEPAPPPAPVGFEDL